jgi:hypothetical protein
MRQRKPPLQTSVAHNGNLDGLLKTAGDNVVDKLEEAPTLIF